MSYAYYLKEKFNMGVILKENVVINDDDSYERLRKEQEYLEYIKNHINNVKKAYVLYMAPLLKKDNICNSVSDEDIKAAIIKLADTIEMHDASKFSDDEFDAYRAKYYPTNREQNDELYKTVMEDRYQDAWKHHYQTNAHHPEHWVDSETGIPRDMSLDAIIELLCDWESMSLRFQSDILKWYENDATDEKKALSPKSREIIEDLLYNVLHKS
jgi:hypothetical protein